MEIITQNMGRVMGVDAPTRLARYLTGSSAPCDRQSIKTPWLQFYRAREGWTTGAVRVLNDKGQESSALLRVVGECVPVPTVGL
jgi:hypothetical protein